MSNINDLAILKKLPLDSTGFADLRKHEQIYIDKTGIIADFASLKGTFFLARPRRFGKSLLINTLHDLFLNGLKNFKNLAIENKWDDTTYNVISINFARHSMKNADEIKSAINRELLQKTGLYEKIKNLYPDYTLFYTGDLLEIIARYIEDRSLVLLIDEYDAPLTYHFDNENELSKILSVLQNFYFSIKEFAYKFRFIFITGITRVAHVSIFSAFNNLNDLTLEKDYANLLGITDYELRYYFHPYIERTAKIMSMPIDDVYAALKARYDGFKFAIDSDETLYNPWSIIKFLLKPGAGFVNYWFESGGMPSILVNYLKINKNFDIWEYKNRDFSITRDDLTAKVDISKVNPRTLLIQAGYFTLHNSDAVNLRFYFPNSEVEDSMLKLYLLVNNLKITQNTSSQMYNIKDYIDNYDINNLIDFFNLILNDCASPKSHFFNDENTLRDLIFAVIPINNKLFKQKEREYTRGRSDLELITDKTHLVIEFKLTRANRSAKKSLEEGIAQIKSRNYGKTAFLSQKLFRIVLVASHTKKRFLPEFSCEVVD